MINISKLKKGDVILINSKGFFNLLVRIFTASGWGHSVLYIGDGKYIESNQYGVMIKTIDRIKYKYISVFRHKNITDEKAMFIVQDSLNYQESGYDYLAIIQLGIQIIFGKRFKQSEIGDKKKWFCSELVATPYYKILSHVLQDVTPNAIIPADFEYSDFFYRVEL